jgi:hypothetical protein
MRLFGDSSQHCTGVVFDIQTSDTSECLAWPSGYYAKTEFNIDPDGTLLNGRKEALVSIPQLREQNRALLNQYEETGSTAPYNEVHLRPTKASALAIFCRTLAYEDLLFTIGIAQLIENKLGCTLPLLVHCPKLGMRIFKLDQQQQMLRCFLAQRASSPRTCLSKHEFKNLQLYHLDRYCGLNVAEKLRLFGLWTCSSDIGTTQTMEDHEAECEGRPIETLAAAVDAALSWNNHRSMLVFAKTAAQLMWRETEERAKDRETMKALDTHFDQRFCATTSVLSMPMLEAVGVFRFVVVICSGSLVERARCARMRLESEVENLSKSRLSRINAFVQARWKNPQCPVSAFVPSAALETRRCFCGSLAELEDLARAAAGEVGTQQGSTTGIARGRASPQQGSTTGIARGRASRAILSFCNSVLQSIPTSKRRAGSWCWRLELIQRLFGLDKRWTHAALTTSCELALAGMGPGPKEEIHSATLQIHSATPQENEARSSKVQYSPQSSMCHPVMQPPPMLPLEDGVKLPMLKPLPDGDLFSLCPTAAAIANRVCMIGTCAPSKTPAVSQTSGSDSKALPARLFVAGQLSPALKAGRRASLRLVEKGALPDVATATRCLSQEGSSQEGRMQEGRMLAQMVALRTEGADEQPCAPSTTRFSKRSYLEVVLAGANDGVH